MWDVRQVERWLEFLVSFGSPSFFPVFFTSLTTDMVRNCPPTILHSLSEQQKEGKIMFYIYIIYITFYSLKFNLVDCLCFLSLYRYPNDVPHPSDPCESLKHRLLEQDKHIYITYIYIEYCQVWGCDNKRWIAIQAIRTMISFMPCWQITLPDGIDPKNINVTVWKLVLMKLSLFEHVEQTGCMLACLV